MRTAAVRAVAVKTALCSDEGCDSGGRRLFGGDGMPVCVQGMTAAVARVAAQLQWGSALARFEGGCAVARAAARRQKALRRATALCARGQPRAFAGARAAAVGAAAVAAELWLQAATAAGAAHANSMLDFFSRVARVQKLSIHASGK